MLEPRKWYDNASTQAFIGVAVLFGLYGLEVISNLFLTFLLAGFGILITTVHVDHQQKQIDRLERAIDRLGRNMALDEHNRQRRG